MLSIYLSCSWQVDRGDLEGRIMTGATEGVCRPLQSRVEQILASETSPVTLYRTTNLIRWGRESVVVHPECPSAHC